MLGRVEGEMSADARIAALEREHQKLKEDQRDAALDKMRIQVEAMRRELNRERQERAVQEEALKILWEAVREGRQAR